jgi:V/A-type H+-transporting ATPase subunit F
MAKIGVIGDRDSVLLFKAVGLDVFFEDEGESANRTLHKLAREGYAIVFVTEKLFPACAETIADTREAPIPPSSRFRTTRVRAASARTL